MIDMNTSNNKSDLLDAKYLSKKVLVNGQFVTLYSANGQTWISSPEDIPDLMARLENARIVLNNAEKPGEAANEKAKTGGDTKAEGEAAPKLTQTKYRMKGPKPRPILRQGGIVVKGTPVEPISASSTVVEVTEEKLAVRDSVKMIKDVSSKNRETASASKKAGVSAVPARGSQKGAPTKSGDAQNEKASLKKGSSPSGRKMDLRKSPVKSVANMVKKSAGKASQKKKAVQKKATPSKKQASSARRRK